MRLKILSILFVLLSGITVYAQTGAEIVAPNNQRYAISGRDRTRNDEEIVYFTTDYYKAKPTFKNGVDVYVVGDKVAIIQDRAGAVYQQYKPDPGAIGVGKDGFVLSANGAARKWILANLKIGDAVVITGNLANLKAAVKPVAAEVPPAASIPCFAGAHYRKAVSSFDVWTGIAGFVKLGTPKVDEARIDPKDNQPLDNFSVYMGGNAGGKHEVDAGVNWNFSTDASGKRSARRNAWRPFWRTKTWSEAPDKPEFTFKPGDTIQMAILVAGAGKLRMIISDAKNPQKQFTVDFDAEGFVPNVPRQFKRVNAIDQRYNEGKPVQATKAEVVGAEWINTILLRGEGANAKQIPLDAAHFTDMRCGARVEVTTTDAAKGAEKINVFGSPKQ
jgi:hypothetical protein